MKMIYRLLLISFLGSSVYAKVNLNTTDASDKKDDEIFYENVLLPRELNEWLKEDDSLKTVINDSANREGNYQSNEALSINDSVSLSVKSLKQLKTILHIPGDRKSAWYAAGALKAWSEIGWWPDSIVGEAWSLPLGWLKNNYVHFDDYLVLSTNLKALTKNKKEVWPFSHYGSLLGSSLYYTNNEWQANPAKEDSLGPKLFQEILFFHLKSFSQQRPVSEIEIASVVNQIKYNQVDSLIEKLEWPNIFNHLVIVPEGKRQEFSNSNNNLALYLPVELTTDSIGFLKGYEWGRRQAKNIFRYINYDPENNAKPLPATHVDKQNFAGFNFEQNSKIQESFWHKLFLNSKLDSTDKEIDFKYLIHQWNHEDRKSYLPNAQLSLTYYISGNCLKIGAFF